MNQDFLETIKEYLTIREDKFRNSVVIQQNGNIIWNCDTPLEKGFLINAHNPNYIRLCSSLLFKCSYGKGLTFDLVGLRMVSKEGKKNVYFDLRGKFQYNRRMDELIIRVNDKVNYSLELAYYDVTEQIGQGNWLHEWGFELSEELFKEICNANHVCDSWESNFVWQANAQLIYSFAYDMDLYYADFVDFFNYNKKEWEKEARMRKKRERERVRKEQEKEVERKKYLEPRERERVRKEQEKEAKKRAEEESKKKAKFWKIVMIIGVLLFVGGIYGCGESEWSWLWMSLIGAITAFVGFVAYEFFD